MPLNRGKIKVITSDLIKQSQQAEPFGLEQLSYMLALPPDSPESYLIMAEAKRVAAEVNQGLAEVHGQFALNLAPCPKDCKFCSFAVCNKIFRKATKLTPEEAVTSAQVLEEAGAAAVYMMTTATYSFNEFIEITQEVRRHIRPETLLIANVSDRTPDEARRLAAAGVSGVYHAWRLREGRDTAIEPRLRLESFQAFKEAGLLIGTCVEPIGPEHTNEEIAEKILFTGSLDPAYSGAARRISVPGTDLAVKYGMISELRMAQCVAVTRLGLPRSVKGNCTHEPSVIGAAAGASLFWAEIGANPRDIKEKTEEGRGFTVDKCRELFWEAGCEVLTGPSVYYGAEPGPVELGRVRTN